MASIETLYDLRHAVDYVVASPCEIMAAGFPYDRILPHLFADETARAAASGARSCREFWEFYEIRLGHDLRERTVGVHLAGTVMSELEGLASAMRRP